MGATPLVTTYAGSKAFAGRGSQLQRGDAGTPTENFVTIAEMKKITRTGSKADLADVTNMDSGNYREKLPTLLEPGEINFEGNYIPSDATQANLQADFDGQALHHWKIILPQIAGSPPTSRGSWSFSGYVTAVDNPDLQVDKEAVVTGKITITGAATYSPT
jgi:predicted secreted protein